MLQSLDRLGLIPGPSESRAAFERRVERMASRDGVRGEALDHTERLYEIRPSWVKITYSKRGLAPWHVGCALVNDELLEIRLRRRRFLGLVRCEELVAHELCHAARMAFPDGAFEEIFAYRTSRGLRRFLGPLFTSPWETWLFMGLTLSSIALDVTFPSVLSLAFKLVPLALLSFLFCRLFLRRRTLHRCVRRLSPLTSSPWSVAFRLSDAEIRLFARMAPEVLGDYIDRSTSPRWESIRGRFFDDGGGC